MNDDSRLDRDVASFIDTTVPSRGPDDLLEDVFLSTGRTRPRPRWLALLKEPPMRLSSSLAVGSPTVRAAAILAATLLLALGIAGAGIAGSRVLTANETLVVDQSGAGDYTTITDAVAVAQDGDTVLVRPGTYEEAIAIHNDIAVIGDGPREAIIIEAPPGGPTSFTGVFVGNQADTAYAVVLRDTEAKLQGLTFRGESSRVHANGGAPLLEDLSFEGVGLTPLGDYVPQALIVTDGTRAAIKGNRFTDGGGIQVYDRSEPLIEENVLSGGPHIVGGLGDRTIIRGNVITGTFTSAIVIVEPTTALIEGNTITGSEEDGIRVGSSSRATGIDPVIRSNTISAVLGDGIKVVGGARPEITDNVLTDNSTAIDISRSAPHVAHNELSGNTTGVVIIAASPTLEGNTITGGESGLVLNGAGATPALVDNTVCGNETNLRLDAGAPQPDIAENDICADVVAEKGG